MFGDDGIGKTFIVKEFIDFTQKSNCQFIYLDWENLSSLEDFYEAIFTAFEHKSSDILSKTLLKINSIYEEKLNWSENDLINTLNIIKMQAVNEEISSNKIAKTIKGSMKLLTRLKPELNGSIDILSEFLTDPWIILSCNYNTEFYQNIRKACDTSKEVSSDCKKDISWQLLKDNLVKLFLYINNHIKQKDTALIFVLDHFENVSNADFIVREKIKKLLSALLEELNKLNDLHLMLLVSCSTQNQSLILGGDLFSCFSNKLLLSSLPDLTAQNFVSSLLESKKINSKGNVAVIISDFSQGQPLWINRVVNYLDMAAKNINIKLLDENFVKQFLPDKLEDILDCEFSLISSVFSSDIDLFNAILKSLLTLKEPYSIFNVAKVSGVNENDCKEVFNELVKYEFLMPSIGEGYVFTHKVIKNYLINQYKQKDIYNTQLLNLLKLLNVVQQQIFNKADPSMSVKYLVDLCEKSNHKKVLAKLTHLLETCSANQDPQIRIASVLGLKELSTPEAIKIILKMISDPLAEVRKHALKACESIIITLGNNQDYLNEIITSLKASMYDKDISIRLKAIDILAKINNKTSSDALINLFKDQDEDVRAATLKALGKIRSSENYYIFLEGMTDKSGKVRVVAAEELSKFKTRQSIQVLCSALEDKDKFVRKASAKTLGELKYQESSISLINALNDPDEDVRINIIRSLGKLKTKNAVPYLREILQKPESEVIYWVATRALGEIPCKEAMDILDGVVNTSSSIVQHAAICSMQRITASLG